MKINGAEIHVELDGTAEAPAASDGTVIPRAAPAQQSALLKTGLPPPRLG